MIVRRLAEGRSCEEDRSDNNNNSPLTVRHGGKCRGAGGYCSDSAVYNHTVYDLPPIGVFWDIENCQIPGGKSAMAVACVIRDQFCNGYRESEFCVVCDVNRESPQVVQELDNAQVNVIHVGSRSKNAAYEKLRQIIRRFADIHGKKAAIVLISDDINYAPDLCDLRQRSYLGMTVHWIDPDTMERKSMGLCCRRIYGSHTYDVLADAIESILDEYCIKSKTTMMITDNGSNFIKAFRIFGPQSETESDNIENENDDGLETETVVEITNILGSNESDGRLPPHHCCSSHTLNLLATTDAEDAAKKNSVYNKASKQVFAGCQALFNKQNRSSQAADIIKKHLGRYLLVPGATRKKIHVIIVHNNICSESLILCASETYKFSELVAGLPLRAAAKTIQLAEVTVSGLPIHVYPETVREKLNSLAANYGGRVLLVAGSLATVRFPSVESAFRAQKRMNGGYVCGSQINVSYSSVVSSRRPVNDLSPSKNIYMRRLAEDESDNNNNSPLTVRHGGKCRVAGGYCSDSAVYNHTVYDLPPIGVFWDIENCQIPRGKSAVAVARLIRDQFCNGYRELEFCVACDIKRESQQVVQELDNAQVNVIHVGSRSKNAADEKLRQTIRRFADIHGAKAVIVLISGDINYAPDLCDLKHRKKNHVILVHNDNCSKSLILCASETYKFSELVAGLPLRAAAKRNIRYPFHGRSDETVKATKNQYLEKSNDSTSVKDVKEFLFSYFMSILKDEGPLKLTEIEDLWKKTAGDFCDITIVLPNLTSMCELLLESTCFCQVVDRLCLAEQFEEVYETVRDELVATVTFLITRSTNSETDSQQSDSTRYQEEQYLAIESKIEQGNDLEDLKPEILPTMPVEPPLPPLDKLHQEITEKHLKTISELTQLVASQQLQIEKYKEQVDQLKQMPMNTYGANQMGPPRIPQPMTTAFGSLALQYPYPGVVSSQFTGPTVKYEARSQIPPLGSSYPYPPPMVAALPTMPLPTLPTSSSTSVPTPTLSMPPPPLGVAQNLLKNSVLIEQKKVDQLKQMPMNTYGANQMGPPRIPQPMTTAFGSLALQYPYPGVVSSQFTGPTVKYEARSQIPPLGSSYPYPPPMVAALPTMPLPTLPTSSSTSVPTPTLSMPPPPLGVAQNLLKNSVLIEQKKDIKLPEQRARSPKLEQRVGSSRESISGPVCVPAVPSPEKAKSAEAAAAEARLVAAVSLEPTSAVRDKATRDYNGWNVVLPKSAMPKHPVQTSGSMSNMKKLLDKLQAKFPTTPMKDFDDIVKQVREQNNGCLSGLAFDEIEARVGRIITRRHVHKNSTMGLIKFSDGAWGTVKPQEKLQSWSNLQIKECTICLEPMGIERAKIDCNHEFHTKCLRKCLKKKSVCPLCNQFTTMYEFPPL